jgi:Blastomyces yeast-phase-specific protein
MHFSTLTGAAALLALAPSAMAVGSATVVNNCGFPIYYASVGQSYTADMQELQGSYTEQYTQPGVGVSIKLSPNNSEGAVSQFEFTWADGKINYDLSNINGAPFAGSGMKIVPSMMGDPNNPSCQEVDCPAGQSVCTAAYNQPNDVRTMVCDQDSDLTLYMCPGGSSKRSEQTYSVNLHRHHARHLPKRA